jgi:hypothetical protein
LSELDAKDALSGEANPTTVALESIGNDVATLWSLGRERNQESGVNVNVAATGCTKSISRDQAFVTHDEQV